ncbi:hypothetical protein ACHAWF_019022 [Thalassiosira exigua]
MRCPGTRERQDSRRRSLPGHWNSRTIVCFHYPLVNTVVEPLESEEGLSAIRSALWAADS